MSLEKRKYVKVIYKRADTFSRQRKLNYEIQLIISIRQIIRREPTKTKAKNEKQTSKLTCSFTHLKFL